MKAYQTKTKIISGTNYGEVLHGAFSIYDGIKKKTKRRPYVRSVYFNKEKVFFDYFREHLFQKSAKVRMKRLRFFGAAVDLIKHSRSKPIVTKNPNKPGETLYKFVGLTAEKEMFFIQIKEDRRGRKYFMSCFGPD